MNTRRTVKVIGFGLINFIARFIVGGILLLGVKMNPTGLGFGSLITVVALVIAYVLLKFVMKPRTIKEALGIAGVWVVMALVLDMVTAEPIVGVTVPYLFSELQTWTRLVVILIVAPFAV